MIDDVSDIIGHIDVFKLIEDILGTPILAFGGQVDNLAVREQKSCFIQ